MEIVTTYYLHDNLFVLSNWNFSTIVGLLNSIIRYIFVAVAQSFTHYWRCFEVISCISISKGFSDFYILYFRVYIFHTTNNMLYYRLVYRYLAFIFLFEQTWQRSTREANSKTLHGSQIKKSGSKQTPFQLLRQLLMEPL